MYLAGGVSMFFDWNTARDRDMTAKASLDREPSVCGAIVDDTIIFRCGVLADTDTLRRVAVARHHVQYGARKRAGTPVLVSQHCHISNSSLLSGHYPSEGETPPGHSPV